LQLINTSTSRANQYLEISEITRALKTIAMELNIAVIVTSQISHVVDSRPDKRPVLSDLNCYGNLREVADVILFLYRDIVYNQDTENPALAELIVAKQRHGSTGTIFLHYANQLAKFEEYAERF